jgi:Tfp pilus assembly protein PilO
MMGKIDNTSLTPLRVDIGGALACAALSLIACFLAVSPLLRQRTALAQQRQQMTDQSQQATQMRAEQRQFAAKVARIRAELATYDLHLQPAARVNQQIAQITSIAGECRLEVSDVQPLPTVHTARHAIVPIELSGTGAFRDCLRFLHRFDQLFADSGVATLELSSIPSSEGSALVSFHFRVHWFVESQRHFTPTASNE